MKIVSICSFLLLLVVFLLGALMPVVPNATQYHTDQEFSLLQQFFHLTDSDELFTTATTCKQCHGSDPEGEAMVDSQGKDINPFDQWQTTMMANSAKDPYWKAKIDHEKSINPNMMMRAMESECTHCHAPIGQFLAYINGIEYYNLELIANDTLAIDGVNCSGCHQISADFIENSFSGRINYDTNRITYGPYDNEFAELMEQFTGFRPDYGAHINQSTLCASCHTLITNSLDLNGMPTGTQYIEQSTYHEWLNSQYAAEGTTCQSCHMPRIEDEVVIASQIEGLPPRSPYGMHTLAGSNVFMINMLKNEKATLGIQATDEMFESTVQSTLDMLKNQSVNLSIEVTDITEENISLDVAIVNKTGHKLPSGFPSRRMFLEVKASVLGGGVIFHSGKLDDDYFIADEDPTYEKHHNTITREDQVQIYEVVPIDISGNPTTLLKTAVRNRKDNRLPPAGFKMTHRVYDTVSISGFALSDPNFNWSENHEGTGSDVVHYKIPVSNAGGLVALEVRLQFHSIAPKWLEEMFEVDSDHINVFKSMYENSDNAPVVMAVKRDTVLLNNRIATLNNKEQSIFYPNPTNQNIFVGDDTQIKNIVVRSLQGDIIWSGKTVNKEIFLPNSPGIYIAEISHQNGEKSFHKIIRH